MRSTICSTAVAVAASLALGGAALAADGSRQASSTGRSSAPTSGGTGAAPRAASAPRAAAPVRAASGSAARPSAPVRASGSTPWRLAADQSPRTAPAGSQPVGTAVSRGGGDTGGGSVGGTPVTSSGGGTETIQSSGHDRQGSSSGGSRKAAPRGDRPRGDHSTVGTASPRTHPPYPGGGGGWDGGYYPPYYWAYGGVGLGYFSYDPYWWGDPWGYGGGYYGGGGGYSSTRQVDDGELRLKVKPKNAEVFVDGHLEGKVDDFDGTFERLKLPEGPHRIELKLQGHKPLSFDVNIIPNELVTYRGKLDPQ